MNEMNNTIPPEVSANPFEQGSQQLFLKDTPKFINDGGIAPEKPEVTPEEKIALHNAACLRAAEATMQAQNYRNYSTMKKLLPDQAMVSLVADTLTETQAADQLSRYDFGAMPLFLAKLKTLTFLEQVDLYRRVNNEISRWNGCKTALECIEDMEISDGKNKQLMKINSMSHFGYMGTQEEFSDDFKKHMEQLKQIAAVLAACIESGKEGLGTTSFTTKEMVALMEKRAADLGVENADPMKVQYANRVIEIFQNRADFTYLKNRLESFLRSKKKEIKRAIAEMKTNKMPKSMKTLVKIFGEDTMYRVWFTLIMKHIDHDADAVCVFFAFLAKLIETEATSGNAVWAKVFILNISDCQRNVFDLMDPYEYLGKIWDIFHVPIDKFLSNNKINSRINPGYNYQFMLKTPEEYSNAIAEFLATHKLELLQTYADERKKAIDEAVAAMKKEDGLTPDDEPIEEGEGVPTDPESFVKARVDDIAQRAEAAGIGIGEVLDAMTPEQREEVLQATGPIVVPASDGTSKNLEVTGVDISEKDGKVDVKVSAVDKGQPEKVEIELNAEKPEENPPLMRGTTKPYMYSETPDPESPAMKALMEDKAPQDAEEKPAESMADKLTGMLIPD